MLREEKGIHINFLVLDVIFWSCKTSSLGGLSEGIYETSLYFYFATSYDSIIIIYNYFKIRVKKRYMHMVKNNSKSIHKKGIQPIKSLSYFRVPLYSLY